MNKIILALLTLMFLTNTSISQTVDSLLRRAENKMKNGKFTDAYKDYDIAKLKSKDSIKIIKHRAKTNYSLNRYNEASKDFETISKAKSRNYSVKLDLAKCYNQLHKFEQAKSLSTEVIENDTSFFHFFAYETRAIAYQLTGKYQEAINDITIYLSKITFNPQAYLIRGKCYRELDEFDKAESDYDFYAAKYTFLNSYDNYIYAMIKRYKKKYTDAKKYFEKAIWMATTVEERKDNEIYFYYFDLARTLAIIDELNEAIKYFDKVVDLNPNYSSAYFYRGFTKFRLNNRVGGCEDLEKAKSLGDKNAETEIREYCR